MLNMTGINILFLYCLQIVYGLSQPNWKTALVSLVEEGEGGF